MFSLRRLCPAIQTAAALALALCGTTQLSALRAAGLNGAAPPNAPAFRALVSTLTNNTHWLIFTGLGLSLAVVFAAVAFGSRRALEHLFGIVLAIMALLVGVPALLS